MKKNLLTFGAVLIAAGMAVAAPADQAWRKDKPHPKPAPAKPAPKPMPKPAPKPMLPPPPAAVEYRPLRNTYTIQLNADKVIIFEQRIVGMRELREKIRMVKFDRPRPEIIVRTEAGVDKARLDFTIRELKAAGFDDIKIVSIPARRKFAPTPRIPAKRIKR